MNICKILKQADLHSTSPVLFFDGQTTERSIIGGILTIFLYMLINVNDIHIRLK